VTDGPVRVAVLDDYQGVAPELADWASLDAEVEFHREHLAGDALVDALAGVEVVVTMRERAAFPREVLDRLRDVRLIVSTGAANAAIDVAAAGECGIALAYGTSGPSRATTELTWGLILAAQRHLAVEDHGMREGAWQTTVGIELDGTRLGLVGLGRLGSAMVPVARAFGMDVVAWSANLTPEDAAERGATYLPLDELLATSDVVSIHLKLGDRSRGLLGAGELARMKPGALLVNTSRGPIVDEAALVEAVRGGRIRAALDVYAEEPLPGGSPLRSLAGATLTPHLGYVTREQLRRFHEESVGLVRAYLKT
jgi:phosphoglycerate dehydrogenase-like enzyme